MNSLPKNKKIKICVQHKVDYKKIYFISQIENYNESKFLNFGIKENFKELKISSFRVKRHLAFKDLLNQYLSDLFNFKYPLFSYSFFIYSIILTRFAGVFFMLAFTLLIWICIKHPSIELYTEYYLNKFFFNKSTIHE